MLSSLAAVAPAFHGAAPLIGLFILGHVFWFIIIVLFIIFAITGRRRRMARWGAWGHGGFGQGGFSPWGHASRAAETTLAERYAQGDIDEKEYRARLEVLRSNNPQGPVPPTR